MDMKTKLKLKNGTLKTELTQAVQKHLDAAAQSHGYDSIFTAIGYLQSTNATFKAEATAFNSWRDRCWEKCHELLAQFEAGQIGVLTAEEVIGQLPELEI